MFRPVSVSPGRSSVPIVQKPHPTPMRPCRIQVDGPISTRVNKPENDDPSIVEPIR
jgi:hypothetical protein